LDDGGEVTECPAAAQSGGRRSARRRCQDEHTQIGSGSKAQTVDGFVTTTGSRSQAQKAYKLAKDDLGTGRATPIRLPSYRNEQIGLISTKTVSKVEVLVRTNRLVWQVETALGAPKATLIANINKYASKQSGGSEPASRGSSALAQPTALREDDRVRKVFEPPETLASGLTIRWRRGLVLVRPLRGWRIIDGRFE
jgi:hypothetical protein